MIQEFLFSDKSKRAEIEKYTPKDIHVEITDIKNSECWTIVFSIPHDDETAAKKLSEVNQHMIKEFKPIVLSNGSAAYYNKRLYPLANEFERKLRKLLYLKSALNPDDKASENIKDLEAKDLGTIFELLFADEQFVKSVKKKINQEMTWQFTKTELHNAIDEMNEDALWRRLIGEDAVPELSTHFIQLKNYRNDIMHAHNISYQTYQDAKKLIEKINQQLDVEIGAIIDVVEKHSPNRPISNYNADLNEAINNKNLVSALVEAAREYATFRSEIAPILLEYQRILSEIPSDYYSILREASEFSRDLSKYSGFLRENGKQSDQSTESRSKKADIEGKGEEGQQNNTEDK